MENKIKAWCSTKCFNDGKHKVTDYAWTSSIYIPLRPSNPRFQNSPDFAEIRQIQPGPNFQNRVKFGQNYQNSLEIGGFGHLRIF
jgi:hypothetical protein